MRRVLLVLTLLFIYIAPAHATISYIQSAQNSASSAGGVLTSVTINITASASANCTLIVTAAQLFNGSPSSASQLPTPTDMAGDVFIPINHYWIFTPVTEATKAWYTNGCIGGVSNVTQTAASSYGLNVTVAEYHSSAPITLDQKGVWPCGNKQDTGTTKLIASPPMYTSTANELLVAWGYAEREHATLAASSSYTIRVQGGAAAPAYDGTLAFADRIVSSRGTYQTTFSGSSATNAFQFAGAASFSEGATVIVPAIEQLACGQSIQAWHELGTFSGQDVILANAQKAGDYIFAAYRVNPAGAVTPTISNANGYTWTVIYSVANYVLWYAVVPMDAVAGDIITFGNINNNNASKIVELHGLSGLPPLASSTATSASMTLTVSGYTTPAYCVSDANDCITTAVWNGIMLDTRSLLGDFLIFAQTEGNWKAGDIPGTTPPPGTVGTNLFPTAFGYFLNVWLPGAPSNSIKHAAQEY